MMYATYLGKHKDYPTEFSVFVRGEEKEVTTEQYDVLKHIKSFRFRGDGVDTKLERSKEKFREKKQKEHDALIAQKQKILKSIL